jgi:peptidoglycan/xylan/chitin deacetylase (PgdA/CDA1 family)
MKQAALALLRLSGGFSLLRLANRSRALILTYHRFGDGASATSTRTLEEQLKFLTDHYRVVPLEAIAACVAAEKPFPTGMAAITIDDGYDDAYCVAFPLLRRFEVPATLFVATDFLDGRAWIWTDKMRYVAARAEARNFRATVGSHELSLSLADATSRRDAATQLNAQLKRMIEGEKDDAIARIASSLGVEIPERPPREFAPITWDEAREMASSGVAIGAHTVTHPILTACTDEHLRRELAGSRGRIEEEIGRDCRLFCYPDGNMDARVRREVERAGYTCGVTVEHGFARRGADPLALPRVHTEADYTHFLQSTSGFEEIKNRLRGGSNRGSKHPAYEY